MKYVLTDTGFWIALLDSDDDKKRQSVAKEAFSYIRASGYKVMMPSIVYSELLNTNFFKRNKKSKIDSLEKVLKLEIIELINDADYRNDALDITLKEGKRCQELSFVDNVIRLIARKFQNHIKYLISFDGILMRECQKYVNIYDKCWTVSLKNG